MKFKYWAYDELNLDLSEDGLSLSLALPWLKIKSTVVKAESAAIRNVLARMKSGQAAIEDILLTSKLLENFNQYPVSYILPDQKKGDAFKRDGSYLPETSPKVVLQKIAETEEDKLEGVRSENSKALETFLADREFQWDKEAALAFAQFNGKIHPESLLTVARRFHMIEVLNNTGVGTIYRKISELPSEKKSTAAAFMVLV